MATASPRILILKLAALGDVLRTTSLLPALHRAGPGCRVTWITSRQALPLLERNPRIRSLMTLDSADPARLAGRFDLVLSMEESLAAVRLARAALAPCGRLVGVVERGRGLGYTQDSAPYYAMSLLGRGPDGSLDRADRLKAANRLTYAELWQRVLGLRGRPAAPSLSLTAAERRAAREFLASIGVGPGPAPIGVNPGAGGRWPAKQLSMRRSARLLEALEPLGRPLVLLGGPEERGRNREILALTAARVLDGGTGHDLRAFAAIVERCALLVTSDSLAFHVATALGVAAVAFAGPTSATELDCFGEGEILTPKSCSCFYRPKCRLKTSCLDRLPLKSIADAARRRLP